MIYKSWYGTFRRDTSKPFLVHWFALMLLNTTQKHIRRISIYRLIQPRSSIVIEVSERTVLSCTGEYALAISVQNYTLKFVSIYTHVIIGEPHSGWVDVIFQDFFQFIVTLMKTHEKST